MKLEFDVRYQLAADLKFLHEKKAEKEVVKIVQLLLNEETPAAEVTKAVEGLRDLVFSDKPYPPEAAYILARCYQYGLGIPKDQETVRKLYQAALKQGFVLAELQLALAGFDGESNHYNRSRMLSLVLIKRAADLGYAPAQARLGVLFQMGLGCKAHPKRAAELYKQAVNNGYLPAQTNLAYCYQFGFGVAKKDIARAITLYRLPAASGNTLAQDSLMGCLKQFLSESLEENVEENGLIESIDICEFALFQGITEASLKLAKLYETGFKTDFVKSLGYYQLFLEKHHAGDTKEMDENEAINGDLKEANEREAMLSPVVRASTEEQMRGFFIDYARVYQRNVSVSLLSLVSDYVAGRLGRMIL